MQVEMRAARRLVETASREPLGMLLTEEMISIPRLGPASRRRRSWSDSPDPSMPGGMMPEAMMAALRSPR